MDGYRVDKMKMGTNVESPSSFLYTDPSSVTSKGSLDRSSVHHRTNQNDKHTLTSTSTVMFLKTKMKPEHLEKTHTGKTCKLKTERPPDPCLNWIFSL